MKNGAAFSAKGVDGMHAPYTYSLENEENIGAGCVGGKQHAGGFSSFPGQIGRNDVERVRPYRYGLALLKTA
jgi:hypothetical protein